MVQTCYLWYLDSITHWLRLWLKSRTFDLRFAIIQWLKGCYIPSWKGFFEAHLKCFRFLWLWRRPSTRWRGSPADVRRRRASDSSAAARQSQLWRDWVRGPFSVAAPRPWNLRRIGTTSWGGATRTRRRRSRPGCSPWTCRRAEPTWSRSRRNRRLIFPSRHQQNFWPKM